MPPKKGVSNRHGTHAAVRKPAATPKEPTSPTLEFSETPATNQKSSFPELVKIFDTLIALGMVSLAAYVHQINTRLMNPIYGSVASNYHRRAQAIVPFLVSILIDTLIRLDPVTLGVWFSVFLLALPKLVPTLYGYSDSWGPDLGPSLTSILSFGPCLLSCSLCAFQLIVCQISLTMTE